MKALLDSNIFNRICDGRLAFCSLSANTGLVVTNIQRAELDATRDPVRRSALNGVLESLNPEVVAAESFALDVAGAGFDEAKWNHDPRVNGLKKDLDALNNQKENNLQDALIAEVALLNNYILMTADRDLATVAEKHRIQVVYFAT